MSDLERLVSRLNAGAYLPPIPKEDTTMAKQVKLAKGKEFVFARTAQVGKYPWDQWLDGSLLLLERSDVADGTNKLKDGGEKRDFEVDTDAMVAKLRTAARRRFKVVQVSKKDADGTKLKDALIIKARDMDAAERLAEEQRRAELKAAGAEETDAADEAAA